MLLTLRPLSEHTGAEILDIDLKSNLNKAVIKKLNQVFSKFSIIVIRNQNLTPDEFCDSAKIFGKIFNQHNKKFALKENNMVHYISNQDKFDDGKPYIPGEGYHTDHSNDKNPPKATILHAKSLPSIGGDTQFVNMHLVYKELPLELKKKVNNLKALHVYQSSLSTRKLMSLSKEINNQPEVVHSLVRVHPENKKTSLYINPIRIEKIIGFSKADTKELLDKLMHYVSNPQNEYRHKWKEGDFVIWDNRILMHKANGDYDMREKRYLYRLMIQN